MTTAGYRTCLLLVLPCLLLLGGLPSHGQQAQQASFERAANPSSSAQQQITFRKRSTQVGDQTDQLLVVHTELNSTVRLAKTEIEKSSVKDVRKLQRRVTATEVQQGRMLAARVKFVASENETHIDQQPATTKREPVVGKTYQCRRDGENILVTDEQGQLPPLAEYEIVARTMESLGKPNPIADFFKGKTIAVGQAVAMPPELAQQLLGLGNAIDTVHQFDFALTSIQPVAEGSNAVFQVLLEASSHENGQMRMQLEGTMVIQSNGCRLVSAELAGPIGMAESMVRAENTFHVTGTGQLGVSINANYTDVR